MLATRTGGCEFESQPTWKMVIDILSSAKLESDNDKPERWLSSGRMLCERPMCLNGELNGLGPPTQDLRWWQFTLRTEEAIKIHKLLFFTTRYFLNLNFKYSLIKCVKEKTSLYFWKKFKFFFFHLLFKLFWTQINGSMAHKLLAIS